MQLIDYVKDMGFTRIELLPINEHPFDAAGAISRWGMRRPGASARRPISGRSWRRRDGHQRDPRLGAGALPQRRYGPANFDGTALYEYADPREGLPSGLESR